MRRITSAVLIAALSLGSLAGCFLLPQASQEKPEPSETAEVEQDDGDGFAATGDCWEANYSDMAEWQSWEGDGPIDCNEDHQSYTYFAGELETKVATPWEDGSMSGELLAAASDECDSRMEHFGIPDEAARAGIFFFVAPENDWEGGDHRIRCDVAVSEIDSDWFDADLEDLPADIDELIGDIDDNPISYELCIIGDGFGPYESTEAYLSDCAGDQYYWRYAGTAEYPETGDEPYPSEDYLFDFGNDECESLGARGDETVLPYVPTPDMWEAGDRVVYCWFSTVEEPSTPV